MLVKDLGAPLIRACTSLFETCLFPKKLSTDLIGWSFVSGVSAAFTRLGALEGQKGIFKLGQEGPGKIFLSLLGLRYLDLSL